MNNVVTLRRFCEICRNVIDYGILNVVVYDFNGEVVKQLKSPKTFDLMQYSNYEVFDFEHEYCWGELDAQILRLREVNDGT